MAKVKNYILVSNLTETQRLWLESQARADGTNMTAVVKRLINDRMKEGAR